MNSAEAAMEFLDYVVENATGRFEAVSSGAGIQAVVDGGIRSIHTPDRLRGLSYSRQHKLVEEINSNAYKVTAHGRELVNYWKSTRDIDRTLEVNASESILNLIVGALAEVHPTIKKGESHGRLVEDCLATVTGLDEKSKLALQILSAWEVGELTKQLVKHSERLANATFVLAGATFLLVGVTTWSSCEELKRSAEAQKIKVMDTVQIRQNNPTASQQKAKSVKILGMTPRSKLQAQNQR